MTILVLKAMVTMVTWGIPLQTPPNGDQVFFWPQIYLMGVFVAKKLVTSITSIPNGYQLPSGYVKIAIEHGHRNSGFSH
jgi:hypothetical protein